VWLFDLQVRLFLHRSWHDVSTSRLPFVTVRHWRRPAT